MHTCRVNGAVLVQEASESSATDETHYECTAGNVAPPPPPPRPPLTIAAIIATTAAAAALFAASAHVLTKANSALLALGRGRSRVPALWGSRLQGCHRSRQVSARQVCRQ